MPRGDQERHLARSTESPRLVGRHGGSRPQSLVGPTLPLQGGPAGIHAQALHDRVDVEAHHARRERRGETEVDGVAGHERAEAGERCSPTQHAGAIGHLTLPIDRQHRAEGCRTRRELLRGGERDRLGARRSDLGAHRHAHVRVGSDPEGDGHPGRRRRERLHADEVQHPRVHRVGNLVDAPHHRLRQEGEDLQEHHPRIRQLVVRPLGTPARDESLGLVDDVLERAVVEIRCGNAQLGSPSLIHGSK